MRRLVGVDPMGGTRAERVNTAVASIRAFHRLGRRLPPKRPAGDAYGRSELAAAAAKHGVSLESARQARQFADTTSGYSPDEVDALCEMITRVQPTQAADTAVFGRTHVVRLLTVARRRRPTLQREAITKGWSTSELEVQIAARFGTRRGGGRRRAIPADAVGMLVAVERMCETWRRFRAAAEVSSSREIAAGTAALPDAVQAQMRVTGRALDKLQQVVTAALREIKPRRDVRPAFRDPAG